MPYDASLRGRSRLTDIAKLVVALSGYTLVIAVPVALVPALPELAQQFAGNGDGIFKAQTVSTLPTIMMLVAAPLGAWVAEIVGIRRCLLGALIAYIVAGLLGFFISGLVPLVVTRMILGLAAGIASTLCTALTADWYEGTYRDRVLGYAHGISTAYNILILLGGGMLVDIAGWRSTSIFYMFGAIVFLAALLVVEDDRTDRGHVRQAKASGSLWSLAPLFLLTFVCASGTCMPIMQGPFLLRSIGVMSSFDRGLAAAFVLFIASLSSAGYGYLRRKIGNSMVLLATTLSMGIGIGLTGALPDIRWIAISYLLTGIGFGLYVPAIAAIILERASLEIRRRAIGFMTSCILMASFANPAIIALFRWTLSLNATFMMVGVAIAFTGLLYIPLLLMTRRTA